VRAAITVCLRTPVTQRPLLILVEEGSPEPLLEEAILANYSPDEMRELLKRTNLEDFVPAGETNLVRSLLEFDVHRGFLYTENLGEVYPIVEGIPRLLVEQISPFREEIRRGRRLLEKLHHAGDTRSSEEAGLCEDWIHVMDHNRQSYSCQWDEFVYQDRIWEYDEETRLNSIREEFEIEDVEPVAGSRYLDGACGPAVPAISVARFGLEVFAFDLSDSVGHARQFMRESRRPQHGLVHLVQASLEAPPFAPGLFDYIYSGGAIHFTPDVRESVLRMGALMKPSGSRIYLWTGRKSRLMSTYKLLHLAVAPVPVKWRRPIFALGTIPFIVANTLGRWIWDEHQFPRRTFREHLVTVIDSVGPIITDLPTPEEFRSWMEEVGVDEIWLKRDGKRGVGFLAVRS